MPITAWEMGELRAEGQYCSISVVRVFGDDWGNICGGANFFGLGDVDNFPGHRYNQGRRESAV